jgi:hypothetical protein
MVAFRKKKKWLNLRPYPKKWKAYVSPKGGRRWRHTKIGSVNFRLPWKAEIRIAHDFGRQARTRGIMPVS